MGNGDGMVHVESQPCRILMRNMRTALLRAGSCHYNCGCGNWFLCTILLCIRKWFLMAPECSRVLLVCQIWAVWNASLPADESRLLKQYRSPARGRDELDV